MGEPSRTTMAIPTKVTKPSTPDVETSAFKENLAPEEVLAHVIEVGALTMDLMAPSSTSEVAGPSEFVPTFWSTLLLIARGN